MSRRLEELHPDVLPMVRTFLSACEMEGIEILVTCTWRSAKEQADLYAQGRTKPGPIVTNAKPGQSSHNVTRAGRDPTNTDSRIPASLAIDVVPMVGGKPMWDAKHPAWLIVGELGEKAGLEWAGRWKRMREFPHFQHPLAAELMGG